MTEPTRFFRGATERLMAQTHRLGPRGGTFIEAGLFFEESAIEIFPSRPGAPGQAVHIRVRLLSAQCDLFL